MEARGHTSPWFGLEKCHQRTAILQQGRCPAATAQKATRQHLRDRRSRRALYQLPPNAEGETNPCPPHRRDATPAVHVRIDAGTTEHGGAGDEKLLAP